MEVFPVGPLLIGDGLERIFGALSCEENDEFGGADEDDHGFGRCGGMVKGGESGEDGGIGTWVIDGSDEGLSGGPTEAALEVISG